MLGHSADYWAFLGTCTRCGHCEQACPSLASAGFTLGDIAERMLAAERDSKDEKELAQRIGFDAALVQAVRGCFFCTSCKNTCFAHNDVCGLVYSARADFQALSLIPRYAWTSVQVDQEWDIFKAYRAIYGIYLGDLVRHVDSAEGPAQHDCETAFFPGCSLAAYSPELTREIFAEIEGLGGKATMIDRCCGSPLKSAGFLDRADALTRLISSEIASSGAKRVVCVCPGCANAMRDALKRADMGGVEVESLAGFLLSHGFSPKRELRAEGLCVSKSCQDRDGTLLEQTCELLGIESAQDSILSGCCGAGGAVGAYDAERQSAQVGAKLSQAPEGSTVVTMCPTCTYTYASHLMSNPLPIKSKHYAELVFESQFDWRGVFERLQGMYAGEYGPWLEQVFA